MSCPPGTGYPACNPCAVGLFSPGGSSGCTLAPSGFYAPRAGINVTYPCSSSIFPGAGSCFSAATPIVSTIAGLGFPDGTGTLGTFYAPRGLCVDKSLNVFLDDLNAIRKITSLGVVSTFSGKSTIGGSVDGTVSSASFSGSYGITMDSLGNIFVADYGNYKVRKINSAGFVSTLAGSTSGLADGVGTNAQFNTPASVGVDLIGNVYVADYSNHRIRQISYSTLQVTSFGSGNTAASFADGTSSSALFRYPRGIAVDSNGNVYVGDYGNHAIRKIVSWGTATTVAGRGASSGSLDGTGTSAQFYGPMGLSMDSSGNLFVADFNNNRIRKMTPAYVVSTIAGSAAGYADGAGATAAFNGPVSVAVDSQNNLYVGDNSNRMVRKISMQSGQAAFVTTLAGNSIVDGVGTSALLIYPAGIDFDSSGNLFIAESGVSRIRKIAVNGAVSTVAGMAGPGSVDKFIWTNPEDYEHTSHYHCRLYNASIC